MKSKYITPTKSDIDRIGRVFFRGGSGSGLKYPDKKHCQAVKDALTLQEIIEVAITTWEAIRECKTPFEGDPKDDRRRSYDKSQRKTLARMED